MRWGWPQLHRISQFHNSAGTIHKACLFQGVELALIEGGKYWSSGLCSYSKGKVEIIIIKKGPMVMSRGSAKHFHPAKRCTIYERPLITNRKFRMK